MAAIRSVICGQPQPFSGHLSSFHVQTARRVSSPVTSGQVQRIFGAQHRPAGRAHSTGQMASLKASVSPQLFDLVDGGQAKRSACQITPSRVS